MIPARASHETIAKTIWFHLPQDSERTTASRVQGRPSADAT